jgi:hypothetical protein
MRDTRPTPVRAWDPDRVLALDTGVGFGVVNAEDVVE